jgi:striatin 1/3/4
MFSQSGLQVITGGHDGSVRVWDVRQGMIVSEANRRHMKKYDEGVMCLAAHSESPFIASGGADSIVNIYEMNNMQ